MRECNNVKPIYKFFNNNGFYYVICFGALRFTKSKLLFYQFNSIFQIKQMFNDKLFEFKQLFCIFAA